LADQADVSFEREIDGGFKKALTATLGRVLPIVDSRKQPFDCTAAALGC
jgi:hypothetical protein